MKKLLISFKDELRCEQKQDNEDMISRIDALGEKLDNKLVIMENEIIQLQSRVKELEQNNTRQERELKKRNLIIYGLPETDKNYLELEKAILNLINNQIKIECKTDDIDFIRRMGKKHQNKTRPIIMGLTSQRKKIAILANTRNLKSTNIGISEDFPKDVLETRKNLMPILKKKKEEGKRVVLKYDKIIDLDETNNRTEILKENKKRNLSEDTNTFSEIGELENNSQKQKQPKIQKLARGRSNSLVGNSIMKDSTKSIDIRHFVSEIHPNK